MKALDRLQKMLFVPRSKAFPGVSHEVLGVSQRQRHPDGLLKIFLETLSERPVPHIQNQLPIPVDVTDRKLASLSPLGRAFITVENHAVNLAKRY